MKSLKLILSVSVIAVMTFSSCSTYKSGDRMPEATSARIDSVSYALGLSFGKSMAQADFGEIDLAQLKKGLMDGLNGKEDTKIKEEDINRVIQEYLRQRSAYTASKRDAENAKFFEENKTKEGVVETESGLQYKIISEGTGIAPELSDTVEVNYKGTLMDGTQFDSSYDRNQTAVFPLNRVIKGWSEGLTHVKEGGHIILYVPANLGYGMRNSGPIPGNSMLIFDVELIKVSKAAPKAEQPAKPAVKKTGKK